MPHALPRLAGAFCLMVSATVAMAQDAYPSKPIRMIIDSAAGSTNDVWARRYAQRLSDAWKQPVVVDNRPGASGSISVEAVVKAPADGYTILVAGMTPMVAYPAAGGVVRYDLQKDLAPVALMTAGYPLLVVNTALGIKSVSELVALAKSRPPGDELACGTSGQASLPHFACEMFARIAGIKLRPVPYKGSSLSVADVATGAIPMAVAFPTDSLPYISQGRAMALAALSPTRIGAFPNAPTTAEAGLQGIEFPSFGGFYVPSATPRQVIDKLNEELVRAMQQPQMKEWLSNVGHWQPMTATEFGDHWRREQARWRRMSEETGIRVEQ